jgi:hypothetical protein
MNICARPNATELDFSVFTSRIDTSDLRPLIESSLPDQGHIEVRRDVPGKGHPLHSGDTDETLIVLAGHLRCYWEGGETTAEIPTTGIALGVFVGQDRALSALHIDADDVQRAQFDLILLAVMRAFEPDQSNNSRTCIVVNSHRLCPQVVFPDNAGRRDTDQCAQRTDDLSR